MSFSQKTQLKNIQTIFVTSSGNNSQSLSRGIGITFVNNENIVTDDNVGVVSRRYINAVSTRLIQVAPWEGTTSGVTNGISRGTTAGGRNRTFSQGADSKGDFTIRTDAQGEINTDSEGNIKPDAQADIDTVAQASINTDTQTDITSDLQGDINTDPQGDIKTDPQGDISEDKTAQNITPDIKESDSMELLELLPDNIKEYTKPYIYKTLPPNTSPIPPVEVYCSSSVGQSSGRYFKHSEGLDNRALPNDVTCNRHNNKEKKVQKCSKNPKPRREENMDGKDKKKKWAKKTKMAKKIKVEEDDFNYHISMASHIPQVCITDAFTENRKLTEDKEEIIDRLKKGIVFKIFQTKTKIRPFKPVDETKENRQNQKDMKWTKRIKTAARQCIRGVLDAFRSCTCSCY